MGIGLRRPSEAWDRFGGVSTEIAPDDIVRTHAQAASQERSPLLVLEPLASFLDSRGLGAGEIEAVPIGGTDTPT